MPVVLFANGWLELRDDISLQNTIVTANVEELRIALLAASRAYSTSIELAYRNEEYAVVEARRIERVVSIETVVMRRSLAAPTRTVRTFSTDAELALDVSDLDASLADRIRRTVGQLRASPNQDV
ncbi:hypothetical protein [Pendulispora albinea]|uniref:Uncharacterized protein n=1 Tax=Pendulispora albinea TaxID=2741071 RepID=A0ABZ2LYX3_9BACT